MWDSLAERILDAVLIVVAGSIFSVTTRNLFRRGRIFISIPIASIKSDAERAAIKAQIADLTRTLRLEHKLKVFCAYLSMKEGYDAGRMAYRECFREIRKCNYFVAFLPELLPTSTYVEVGFAIAKRKSVSIYHVEGALPYLLKELATDGVPLTGSRILVNRSAVASLSEGIDRLKTSGLEDFPGWAKRLRFASRESD